jgi:hypothetical protein
MSHTLEELEAMRQQAQAMLDRAEASHQALLASVRNLGVNPEEVEAYWRSVGPLSAEDEAGLARVVQSIAESCGAFSATPAGQSGAQRAEGRNRSRGGSSSGSSSESSAGQPASIPASRLLRGRMASRI